MFWSLVLLLGLSSEIAWRPNPAAGGGIVAQAIGRRRLALLSRTDAATINRPNGDLTPHWPEEGPKIVWQASLGTGYSSPVTSQGRLFQFDRQGNRARLRAFESETGKPLWQFEYPSDFEDTLQL